MTSQRAPADEIDLVTGSTLRGVIVQETPEEVQVLVAGLNRITLPIARVADVRRATDGDNALLMATIHLEQGLLWQAGQHLTDALEEGVPSERIAPALLARPAALTTRLQSEPEEQARELRNLFLGVLGDVPRDDEVLYLAGRICEVTGDTDRALSAYGGVNAAFWWANPEARLDAAHFYRSRAQAAMREEDFAGVIGALEQLTVVDPSLASELRPIFLLRSANTLIDQGHWADAIQIVGEVVSPMAPQIARVWLESVFSELEHRPLHGESLTEIVPLFEQNYALYFEDAGERLSTLHWRLGEALLANGEYALARRAFNRHYDLADTEEDVRPQVLACNFLEEASQLPPDDIEGHLRLITEMADQGLHEAARLQFDLLPRFEDARLETLVIQQRRAIEGRLAEESWNRAWALYEEGRYEETLDVLSRDADLYHSARLLEEGMELRRLCENAMAQAAHRNEMSALARFQEAERRFFMGDYAEAIPLYEQVIREYIDTEAADDSAARLTQTRRWLAVRSNLAGLDLDGIRSSLDAALESAETPGDAQGRELQSMIDAIETEREETGELPPAQ